MAIFVLLVACFIVPMMMLPSKNDFSKPAKLGIGYCNFHPRSVGCMKQTLHGKITQKINKASLKLDGDMALRIQAMIKNMNSKK